MTDAGWPVTAFIGLGALARGVDGGAGGDDTLAYVGGSYDVISSLAMGPNFGSVTADGVTAVYDGLKPVTLVMTMET